MIKISTTFKLLLLLIITLGTVYAYEDWGTYLGEFNGVPSYSNGNWEWHEGDYNYENEVLTGVKWQCVEYVNRYYKVLYDINMTSLEFNGNANTYLTVAQGVSGINVINNDGSNTPQVGDLLVSEGTPGTNNQYGHVAIVREVGTNYLKVIQQNFLNDANDIDWNISIDNNGVIDGFNTSNEELEIQGLLRPLAGCTNSEALNYNPDAIINDGSCEYIDFGDINNDGAINVLDIVIMVNFILGGSYDEISDINEDGQLNVLDVITLVNLIIDDGSETVTDIDGNVYQTVQIGEQLWMAENLKVTHYNNGDEISNPSDEDWGDFDEWQDDNIGAYAVYPIDNDDASQATCGNNCADVYGNLYNFYTVIDVRGICPDNFHVPSDNEWRTLTDYLAPDDDGWGTNFIAGGMMKATGTIEDSDGLWYSPNEGATNESGFTGLPAGIHSWNRGWSGMGFKTEFWTSSFYDGLYGGWERELHYDNASVYQGFDYGKYGYSVRCLKD